MAAKYVLLVLCALGTFSCLGPAIFSKLGPLDRFVTTFIGLAYLAMAVALLVMV